MSQSSLRIPIVLTTPVMVGCSRVLKSQSSLRIPIVLTKMCGSCCKTIAFVSILTEDSDRSNNFRFFLSVFNQSVSILTEDSDRSNKPWCAMTTSVFMSLNPH